MVVASVQRRARYIHKEELGRPIIGILKKNRLVMQVVTMTTCIVTSVDLAEYSRAPQSAMVCQYINVAVGHGEY